MEKLPVQENRIETESALERFLCSYEIREDDITSLGEKIETIVASDLLNPDTIEGLRIATFDSGNLYIFSREPHVSTEQFEVVDMGQKTPSGFHCYKISSKELGVNLDLYRGAWASKEMEEISKTRSVPEKEKFVAYISPEGAYEHAKKGEFDYLTDMVAHEFGHLEESPLWGVFGEDERAFQSEKSRREFEAMVEKASFVPEWLRKGVIARMDARTISEMYAMIVDGEAKRRFRKELYNTNEGMFLAEMKDVKKEDVEEKIQWEHYRGYMLARILDTQIPDYQERKEFVLRLLAEK